MSNQLTDRDFWLKYWESKRDLATLIPPTYLFHSELQDVISRFQIKTAIELGGFPGYYAVFLKKYAKLDVTLLDYFIHPPVINNLLRKNGLRDGDISIIEADLFNYLPKKEFDLVLSCGLIEHFEDTEDIILKHVQFMNPGGTLFITLPNFNALNGWFQKKFDTENYNKHNLLSMDPDLLSTLAYKAGLQILRSEYFGRFSIWLENERTKPLSVRILAKVVWFSGKILSKILPFESRRYSPYIILVAKKPG